MIILKLFFLINLHLYTYHSWLCNTLKHIVIILDYFNLLCNLYIQLDNNSKKYTPIHHYLSIFGEPNLSKWSRENFKNSCSDILTVYGQWTEWSTWSECSNTPPFCYQRRTRTCKRPPSVLNGNPVCDGQSSESKHCPCFAT